MTLTIILKPEGHDLRAARAARTQDNKDWLPEDALYDAWLGMEKEPPVLACVIAWYARDKDGKLDFKFRMHQEQDLQSVALAAALLAYLSHP
jgi:hypothetical protein